MEYVYLIIDNHLMTRTYPFKLVMGDNVAVANTIAAGRNATRIIMTECGGHYVG